MSHKLTIAGEPVEIAWNNETAKRFGFRASAGNVNVKTLHKDFTNPTKAGAAFASFLWLVLPPAKVRDYPTPEDVFIAITEDDVASVHTALIGVIADMVPDAEKKSTSKKSRSPESNSD
jgi:hypothetical protein